MECLLFTGVVHRATGTYLFSIYFSMKFLPFVFFFESVEYDGARLMILNALEGNIRPRCTRRLQ